MILDRGVLKDPVSKTASLETDLAGYPIPRLWIHRQTNHNRLYQESLEYFDLVTFNNYQND